VVGKIIQQTQDNIRVQIPSLISTTREVKIRVKVNGNVLRDVEHIPYKSKISAAINLRNYILCTPNNYTTGSLGGISDLTITLQNKSNYSINDITVEISYLKRNGEEFKKEILHFKNIQPNSSTTKEAPKSGKGDHIKLSIKSIYSDEFGEQ
jgi:hypothetical protein